MNTDTELQRAVDAVDRAAELLGAYFADAGVQSQTGRDIKTQADVAAEACLVEHLSPSDIPILAEESAGNAGSATDGLRWLVDPLDGTMNFTRGFPICAVSVGLWDGPNPLLGVVYDLGQRTLYTGIVGEGAWRDGQSIHVSAIAETSQAILTTGFPVGQDFATASLDEFIGRVQAFKKIRMIGSAALSLARVAEGVFDAYYEDNIMIWDVAAGLALVTAAGGQIQSRPGTKPHALVATATNGHLTL
jgi:fructose-1,6-bisphosphatase/inositol monophosphatase family enzyme